MKRSLVKCALAIILGISAVSSAQAPRKGGKGGQSGGGGEPMAQQFIVLAKQLAIFFKDNPFKIQLPFAADDFKNKVEQLDKSLQIAGEKALVEFTEDILRDYAGKEKPALFDRLDSSVLVNRTAWLNYSKDPEGRLALVTKEIAGLVGVNDYRYEESLKIVHNRAALILSIPLNEKDEDNGSNSSSGMRIVGQDHKQFDRINEADVLIDGGILGTGDANNQRVDKFLNNPSQDEEWYEAVQLAWKKNRAAYFLLAGPDGNTASISSIYPAQWASKETGLGMYSLMFVKYKQIYDGPCVGTAKSLSALERLKNCFLSQNHYGAYDTLSDQKYATPVTPQSIADALRSVTTDFKGRLLYLFAWDKRVLQAAIRDNFIVNYSSLAIPLYESRILSQTLAAHGLVPSLVGPFAATPFWVKTSKQPISAIRTFTALKTLADLGLSFMDSGTQCVLGEEKYRGPQLIAQSKIRELYNGPEETCHSIYYRLPRDIESELFPTMIKAGFYFDYDNKTWRYEPKEKPAR
ncbi:MAG: hypothetical protein JNL11_19570 [Bdellovibrionaceae bacterium]|nr:hypothetical protein [Pseudobdellovibrionaceae bacterium]